MTAPIQMPLANFSRDLRAASLITAAASGFAAAGLLIAAAILTFESFAYGEAAGRAEAQGASLSAEAGALRREDLHNPGAAAATALRQRIASLNSLDFGQAPAVTSVLTALEEVMPGTVALESLDYDRANNTLILVAVSPSSEELTAFFDAASRSPSFKAVRLADKKQGSAGPDGALQFLVRLSITPAVREPRA
jgi:Tfp pilus assembly protein PilN